MGRSLALGVGVRAAIVCASGFVVNRWMDPLKVSLCKASVDH